MEKQYFSIKEASAITGLSQWYLRNGCKEGTIPHIKSGNKYLINVPQLYKRLEANYIYASEEC